HQTERHQVRRLLGRNSMQGTACHVQARKGVIRRILAIVSIVVLPGGLIVVVATALARLVHVDGKWRSAFAPSRELQPRSLSSQRPGAECTGTALGETDRPGGTEEA